jgi:hypothetical protein
VLFVLILGAAAIAAVCETNERHFCTSPPTPLEANSPKPDYVKTGPALQAKIDAAAVALDILLQTSAPTVFPTPHPTNKVAFIFILLSTCLCSERARF